MLAHQCERTLLAGHKAGPAPGTGGGRGWSPAALRRGCSTDTATVGTQPGQELFATPESFCQPHHATRRQAGFCAALASTGMGMDRVGQEGDTLKKREIPRSHRLRPQSSVCICATYIHVLLFTGLYLATLGRVQGWESYSSQIKSPGPFAIASRSKTGNEKKQFTSKSQLPSLPSSRIWNQTVLYFQETLPSQLFFQATRQTCPRVTL